LSRSAAALATAFPVAESPVSDTDVDAGMRTSAAPAAGPSPVTTLNTPRGKMSAASAARRSVVSGVCSDGLSTTVLPAASAGLSFVTAISSG
jgi:hypothetical protein